MALPAIHHSGFNIDVSLAEACCLVVMTLAAQGLYLLGQQTRLRRKMGLMTLQAVPGSRRMILFFANFRL
jgi:hypothetical protein